MVFRTRRRRSGVDLETLHSVADFYHLAETRLPKMAFDYYAGGADTEQTLADNTAAWAQYELRPHVLRDVRTVNIATTVLGQHITAPIMVGPTGHQRLAHEDGEAATAVGAGEAGTVFVVPTFASVSLEDVAAAAPSAPKWFQLYIHRDRGLTAELVNRAEVAGYRAIVVTVDVPVHGNRLRDVRNGFSLPDGVTLGNFEQSMPTGSGSDVAANTNSRLDAGIGLREVTWLREVTQLPIVIKGVMRGDDASEIAKSGVDGIVVSNHGGRQLDGARATARALEEVASAVGERCEVYVDGGVRTGVDVVRALALGARAVWVGRPSLWGLTIDGASGVRAVLDLLQNETKRTLALCGIASVDAVPRDLVV